MSKTRIRDVLVVLLGLASLTGAGPADPPLVSAGQPSGVVWLQSYEAGMKMGRDRRMPVLLFFTASWCPWCHKLEQEVFSQPQVLAELRKFVCVKLDAGGDHNVATAYGVVSLPRVFVINTLGEVVGDWLGYRDGDELLQRFADVQPYANTAAGTRKAPQVLPRIERPGSNSPPPQAIGRNPSELMEILGSKEPTIRQNATVVLTQSGPAALPVMLDALKHEYLGVRIAAWKIVRTLGKTDADFDPWASQAERTEAVNKLQEPSGNAPPTPAATDNRTPEGFS